VALLEISGLPLDKVFNLLALSFFGSMHGEIFISGSLFGGISATNDLAFLLLFLEAFKLLEIEF
jgi:hypothetical protein